jgi:hypothetical protein
VRVSGITSQEARHAFSQCVVVTLRGERFDGDDLCVGRELARRKIMPIALDQAECFSECTSGGGGARGIEQRHLSA